MKSFIIGAFLAAQINLVAQPALAADLVDDRGAVAQRHGTFAGARMRISLDSASARKVQAGLTLAPVTHARQSDGGSRTRFGEGMELRLTGAAKPELAVAGRSLDQLAEGRSSPEGRKAGISTIGWIAIGVGTVALAFAVLFAACTPSTNCIDDGDG
jgi:hypothetical protein